MKRILLAALLLLAPGAILAQDLSLIDSAMAQLGMTAEDIKIDQDEMATWGGDLWRLSFFTMLHKNPFKLPKYGQMNLEAYTVACDNISALLADAGRKIDCPVRRGLIDDPLQKYLRPSDSLAFTQLVRGNGIMMQPELERMRAKVGLIYELVSDTQFSFGKVLLDFANARFRNQLFQYFVADSQEYHDVVEMYATQLDFNRLIGGAQDLGEALKRAADSLEYCAFPAAFSEVATPYGLIVFGTMGSDDYAYGTPPLLILDPGGNDVYQISGYANDYPLSAIIDLSGNDRYVSPDSTRPGIGGAVLGMAVVIDKSGNDRYEAVHIAQGAGLFGVGLLLDQSGDDVYSARTLSQGSGSFGAGICSDVAGNDSLYCWATSQGYGYTKGCGLCINLSGDDKYVAEDAILFSPGQQTQEHNSSLAQGAAFGRRADFIDGHSWAGGIGILCDVAGNDKYSAGLFAQGCGYWFAVGMLLDGDGSDNYHSAWYTLGSGAHFAIGYLDDFAGDDIYNATMNMSLGSGHDFTIGYLNERAGNDTYLAPGLSLGGGNFQGIGIFHDWSGDDNYQASGAFNVGGARGLEQGARAFLYTFGVFADGGGNDSYSGTSARNNSRWISAKPDSTEPGPFEVGVGIDK